MEAILLKNIKIAGKGDREHDILIEGGVIRSISGQCGAQDAEPVDCRGKVAVPGFVNMHIHAAMTLMRGMGEDVPFHTWLRKIWDIESRVDEEFVYWGTRVACLEMARTGTTTFNDHYWFPAASYRAADIAQVYRRRYRRDIRNICGQGRQRIFAVVCPYGTFAGRGSV